MPSSGVQTCALRSEEHTSELQSHDNLVCRLLLDKRDGLAAPGRRPQPFRRVVPRAGASSPDRTFLAFFFNDTATTEIYTLSLHDALPISWPNSSLSLVTLRPVSPVPIRADRDRKSTRLNSSHTIISYAVFCLKKNTHCSFPTSTECVHHWSAISGSA